MELEGQAESEMVTGRVRKTVVKKDTYNRCGPSSRDTARD